MRDCKNAPRKRKRGGDSGEGSKEVKEKGFQNLPGGKGGKGKTSRKKKALTVGFFRKGERGARDS